MRHRGPRKGKSSSRAIPTVLAAPGAAFATSNKPDLYAATRAVREQHGRIWNLIPRRSRWASLIGGGTRSATSHRIVVRSS